MFIPSTQAERAEMLKKIGLSNIEDLFADVPKEFRYPELNLPDAMSEMEALQN